MGFVGAGTRRLVGRCIPPFALVAMYLVASVPSLAIAQVTASGPYYANPAWDQALPAATRFIVLSSLNSEAVLDRETGLVWEKSPSTTPDTWYNSLDDCAMRAIGGRKGWRLPSAQELASLVDPTATNPALPGGHPFANIQPGVYWASSVRLGNNPWSVNFASGDLAFENITFTPTHYRWCVRGGQNNNRDY